ncbi:YpiF family protein [Paenibacillus sp. ACRRX]|uniref:DUF2487 family protein n=1 Tax=Paenibacillus sp. ACRRX TaxID=2918206 RepID=UPI001EF6A7CD|nr:DUF2487 family protein [Paenibacillus sp. ACRRX]MCG7406472.1 YpiF family protein [Paenibacillus sp. ACRRX]
MKFSEISEAQWQQWKPYLDTCVIPVTGLTGALAPYQATQCLEQLRDWLEHVEIPFHGRIVTYPAYHFVGHPSDISVAHGEWTKLDRLAAELKGAGFRYVIGMSAQVDLPHEKLSNCDLVLTPFATRDIESENSRQRISELVQTMWSSSQY